MRNLQIAFIGGGNMAEALISGLIHGGHAGERICVAEPREDRRRVLEQSYRVRVTDANAEAARDADVLVLAVKPQQMREAVRGLILKPDATVLSIAAGIDTEALSEWLGADANLVRVMPNTPALVGAGMSVIYVRAGEEIHALRAEYLLKACGEVARVEREAQMHAVTAVSGSGPAYFFLLAEMVQAAGVSLGLPEELARKLVSQTALGAGRMLCESGRSATELRQQVTSPGGTTQAALDTMYEMGLPDAVRQGVVAASRRSKELG